MRVRRVLVLAAACGAAVVGALLLVRDDAMAPPDEPPAAVGVAFEQRGAEAERVGPLERTRAPLNEADAAAPDTETLAHLAETSDDPRVIEASLREIPTTYSSRSSQKRRPDAALDRVLIKHVHSNDPAIAAAALDAARIPLMTNQPSDELTSAIAGVAAPESDRARRGAALQALNLIRPDRRGAHVLAAFETALSASEPYVVSLALLALSQSGASLEALPAPERSRIGGRVLELAGHQDPGVRGRALAVLSEIEALVTPEARFGAADRRFDDPHPYVRAQAADLFLRCRQPSAIHRLIDSVSDLSRARYELTGFPVLPGAPASLLHGVPGRERVAEAALLAILVLVRELPGVPALELTLGGRPQPDIAVRENAEIARAWYRSQRDRIPRGFVPHR